MSSNNNYKTDGTGHLHERVAVVTGSSSGIGRAIALALAREGAYVICSDLRAEASQDGFEEDKDTPTHIVIRKNGGVSDYCNCDIGKTENVFHLIEFAVEVSTPIDLLVTFAIVKIGR